MDQPQEDDTIQKTAESKITSEDSNDATPTPKADFDNSNSASAQERNAPTAPKLDSHSDSDSSESTVKPQTHQSRILRQSVQNALEGRKFATEALDIVTKEDVLTAMDSLVTGICEEDPFLDEKNPTVELWTPFSEAGNKLVLDELPMWILRVLLASCLEDTSVLMRKRGNARSKVPEERPASGLGLNF